MVPSLLVSLDEKSQSGTLIFQEEAAQEEKELRERLVRTEDAEIELGQAMSGFTKLAALLMFVVSFSFH